MNAYERETIEFIAVTVEVDGTPVTTGVELAVTSGGDRPTTWQTPTTLSGRIGVLIDRLPRGVYTVWARVTSTPEVPVIRLGTFAVQ